MTAPLRITVVEQDGSGGLIHYAYQLCDALAARSAEITLVTGRHYELAHLPHSFDVDASIRLWPAIEDAAGSPNRAVGRLAALGRRGRRVVRALRYAWAWELLTRSLLRRRPDVVLFSVIRFPFQAFWLRRLHRRGIPMAQICHEFEPRESRFGAVRRLTWRWARRVYPCFSAVFLHGEANRDRFGELFPGVPRHRTHVIPHGDESMFLELDDPGGDLRARYGIGADRPVALFFGGIRPSKGVDDLIRAFATVRREIEASLLVVGHPAGVNPDDLTALAADLGVGADVVVDPHYLPMAEIGPLVRSATAVVLPYRSATASGVLQVAYAFARPVVVTDTGALADAVEDGATGLVVPAGDHDAMARALVKILSDPAEAALMGRRGREWSEAAFGWDTVAERVLGVLAALDPGGECS